MAEAKKTKTNKAQKKVLKAKDLILEMEKKARQKKYKDKRPILQRFFKTGKGQYAEGDVLIGLPVPIVREFAKKYLDLSFVEIKKLLNHKTHEIRLVGLLILVEKYQGSKEREEKKSIVGFYLQNTKKINNWDLVDLSAYKILGDFLLDEAPSKARKILSDLSKSKNMWERRIAMVSTYAFIKKGKKEEAILIANNLIKDTEDLIHKSTGWMLREMGKRISVNDLESYLKKYGKNMPRVALRYATEKLDKTKKAHYYNLNKK